MTFTKTRCKMVLLIICLTLVFHLTPSQAYTYKKTKIGKSKTYRSGCFYITLKTPYGSQTGKITLSRKTAPKYKNMFKKSYLYQCNMKVSGAPLGLKLNQRSVKTKKNGSNHYLIFDLSLSYNQPEYTRYLKETITKPKALRMNFKSYDPNNKGTTTIIKGEVKEDTKRTIHMQIHASAVSLITYKNIAIHDARRLLLIRKRLLKRHLFMHQHQLILYIVTVMNIISVSRLSGKASAS